LSDDEIVILANGLKHPTKLNIKGNNAGLRETKAITDNLTQLTLLTISNDQRHIGCNYLGDDGAIALSNVMPLLTHFAISKTT
jgi:hypothetical protein